MHKSWIRIALIFLLGCFGISQQQGSQPAPPANNGQQSTSSDQSKPQTQTQQPSQPPDQKKSKFGGMMKKPVTASNSAQSKDTASLGSNGLGDDGMPTTAQMDEPATGDDEAKAAALSTQSTDPAEVSQFIQQGNLKGGKN